MRKRSVLWTGWLLLAIAAGAFGALRISGQTAASRPSAYAPPRLRDGHPDLQGIYDLATLTPLERPAGAKAVLTDEEAARLEKNNAARNEREQRALPADRTAP